MANVLLDIEGDRISLRFGGFRNESEFKADVELMQKVAGRKWNRGEDRHWTVPKDMGTCRLLRELFGSRLTLSQKVRDWATVTVRQEDQLGKIAIADHAELTVLPHVLPKLYEAIYIGPLSKHMTPEERKAALAAPHGSYQTADVRYGADAPHFLNGLEPGLGKTIETVAIVFEAKLDNGKQLVIAPKAAVETTWPNELNQWQPHPVFVCSGTRAQRQKIIDEFMNTDGPAWIVVNSEMVRFQKDKTNTGPMTRAATAGEIKKDENKLCKCSKGSNFHWHYNYAYPEFFQVKWNTITNDEVHKGNVRNHKTVSAWSINSLKLAANGKRMALSGTPMKKKNGHDIYGTLKYLRPDVFTAYWNFVFRYFEVSNNGFGNVIGPMLEEKKPIFYREMQPYILRRTKAECAPWLPNKLPITKFCKMGPEQEAQYRRMEAEGAYDETYTTTILTEFLRLRQFANGLHEFKNGKLLPTTNSCKLDMMDEWLDEIGAYDDGTQVIIGSQFEEWVSVIVEFLLEKGLKVSRLTGKENKRGQRTKLENDFNSGKDQIMVMTMQAGGVAINLQAADHVIAFDEPWSPDEMIQFEDRAHRANKKSLVTVCSLATMNTIDQDVTESRLEKLDDHLAILDVRRKIMARNSL
jgi:SNF2 family DNA or RNA helicase